MINKSTASHVSWDNSESFTRASATYQKGLQTVQPMMKSSAAMANRWQNIDANTSVRDSFSQMDYGFFRPGEVSPRHFRDIIIGCMAAYRKVPVIGSTIDLMGDFCTQGVRLVHEDQEVENLFKEW